MSFQTPITIFETIKKVHEKKYLLPAIQREFVWSTDQIERLFDSLMREYPIGSFLFWEVEKNNVNNFQFYEFIREFSQKDPTHNPKADISGEDGITAILDGQQRLTSLYLGFKGTYAYKIPRKRWDNPHAFPKRKLYLNLLQKSDYSDYEYDFAFLTDDEANENNNDVYWFKVGDILNLKEEYKVNEYLIEHGILNHTDNKKAIFANQTLYKLHSLVHKNLIINYYLEKDEKIEKVLNIFIRVNSGGTELSYSDLLLSIATAQWDNKDAREEITTFVDELNSLTSTTYNFNKDFILKSSLVLCDFKDIAFKVDNFNKKNMLHIEENWEDLTNSLCTAVSLISNFGYSRETLTSNNAIIPIAYYLLKNSNPHNFLEAHKFLNDRNEIEKYLRLSLLKRTFGGQPDSILRPIRKIISENNTSFPFDLIKEEFRGKPKTFIFDNDEIENLLDYKYGQNYTFSVLALLYPHIDFKNKFNIDHIFPKSKFTKRKLKKEGIDENKIDFYLDNVHYLGNLQLLEGTPNREKSDNYFKEWLFKTYKNENERKDFMKKNYIPDVDLNFNNFEEFFKEREKLILNKLISLLK